MNIDHQRAAELFEQVSALPAEARASFLARVCGQDPALVERLKELLLAADEAGSFLPLDPGDGATATAGTAAPRDRVGRYKLLEKIGEGGCGVVYMAEQEEPVRRRVALKVIKPGMD